MRNRDYERYEDEDYNHGGDSSSRRSGRASRRGFAAMDPEEQREIASMGGRAAHESGHAHEFDSEEAREAGRLGGRSRSRGYSRSGSDYDYDDDRRYSSSSRGGHENYDYDDSDYDRDESRYGSGRGGNYAHRGFAAMDPEEQREIARMGGRASHGGYGRGRY